MGMGIGNINLELARQDYVDKKKKGEEVEAGNPFSAESLGFVPAGAETDPEEVAQEPVATPSPVSATNPLAGSSAPVPRETPVMQRQPAPGTQNLLAAALQKAMGGQLGGNVKVSGAGQIGGPLSEAVRRQRAVGRGRSQQIAGQTAKAYSDLGKSIEGVQEQQRQQAEYELGLRQQQMAQEAILQQRFQQTEQRRQEKINTMANDLSSAMDELRSMAIEPKQVFQEGETARNIGTAIALALGQFGGALTGGQNLVERQFDQAIERDLQAQKLAVAKKQADVQGMVNTYDLMKAKFGDERMAEQATIMALRDGIERELQMKKLEQGAGVNNPVLDQAIANNNLKKAAALKQIVDGINKQEMESLGLEIGAAGLEIREKQAGLDEAEFRISGMEPTGETTLKKDNWLLALKSKAAYDKFRAILNDAIQTRRELGFELPLTEVSKGMETISFQLEDAYRIMAGYGAPQAVELERLEDKLGGLSKVGWKLEALEQLKETSFKAFAESEKAYGYRPTAETEKIELGFQAAQ